YQGLNNGPDASKLSITASQYSLSGRVFREDAGKLNAGFMTAFEMSFLLAEATEKGYIIGNAKEYYETGITQAFEYWSVPLPADYLTRNHVSYKKDGANPIQQIITQKWLGNIINGYEGWIEYRRTGFPVLKPVTASLNQGKIPIRMPYPISEEALNSNNFKIASSNTNNNSVNTPVWWDK
ncbi:MAG: SusD/RagB family nutrient-binding outer membrane lipoprotein, partial [Saprospiraceae bacterium]